MPDWLELHGVPLGHIGTGISGIPFIAKDEKVRDISEVFEGNPEQKFVMFGDSSHVDPDAYREILAKFPGRVHVAFIHDVKSIDPSRLVGLNLVDNYAQAAAELFRLELISEDEARMVMTTVVTGGEITDAELEDLIANNQPN
jgi:phosphatidate phosphatase APP1